MNLLTADKITHLTQLATRFHWRLVVLFGSTLDSPVPRDIDLAVLPTRMPDLLQQGGWQAEVETLFHPHPVDLVVLGDATSPITRFEVFRRGRCLYEASPGLVEQERDRAFFLYADSEKLRAESRETLYRSFAAWAAAYVAKEKD